MVKSLDQDFLCILGIRIVTPVPWFLLCWPVGYHSYTMWHIVSNIIGVFNQIIADLIDFLFDRLRHEPYFFGYLNGEILNILDNIIKLYCSLFSNLRYITISRLGGGNPDMIKFTLTANRPDCIFNIPHQIVCKFVNSVTYVIAYVINQGRYIIQYTTSLCLMVYSFRLKMLQNFEMLGVDCNEFSESCGHIQHKLIDLNRISVKK